jgi:hypothetical protein
MSHKYFIAFVVNANHTDSKQPFYGNKVVTYSNKPGEVTITSLQKELAKQLSVEKVVITFFNEIPS